MFPTFEDGDFVYIKKTGYTISNGDIVVIKDKCFSQKYVVKRVIAVGGQSVTICYNDNIVMIDGVQIDEPYLNYADDDVLKTYNGRSYEVYTVPSDHVFLLGDNRNHSIDSRKCSIGYIPTDSIVGKIVICKKWG